MRFSPMLLLGLALAGITPLVALELAPGAVYRATGAMLFFYIMGHLLGRLSEMKRNGKGLSRPPN